MLAEIAQTVLELILQVILEFVLYWVGKLAIAVLTLGQVHCDCYDRESAWSGGWRIGGRDANGVFLSAEATSLIGLLVIAAIVVCVLHFH